MRCNHPIFHPHQADQRLQPGTRFISGAPALVPKSKLVAARSSYPSAKWLPSLLVALQPSQLLPGTDQIILHIFQSHQADQISVLGTPLSEFLVAHQLLRLYWLAQHFKRSWRPASDAHEYDGFMPWRSASLPLCVHRNLQWKDSKSSYLACELAWMEASNRKQPVAGKERIFEELQDLISDQLKVRWVFCISAKLMRHLHNPLCTILGSQTITRLQLSDVELARAILPSI